MPAPLIGRTLGGRFRVTGFIGEGAMASVYRGVQEAEPQDVAIKIMHEHLVGDPTFIGRFKREAKAAAQILHPNTVRVLDAGVEGSIVYIAMELLGGQDLFELLVLEKRLSEARAVRIIMQVAEALEAAHARGIIHRDLKPENVMLLAPVPESDDALSGVDHAPEILYERVKVLDFGIAKILDPDELTSSRDEPASGALATALTTVGMVVGTPQYMSPEQCRGETIDTRSDLYACGALLHQLVTGRPPFHGTRAMELAAAHIRTPAPALSTLLRGVNPKLEKTVLRALAKWPAERQQTARELYEELASMLAELSNEALPLLSPMLLSSPNLEHARELTATATDLETTKEIVPKNTSDATDASEDELTLERPSSELVQGSFSLFDGPPRTSTDVSPVPAPRRSRPRAITPPKVIAASDLEPKPDALRAPGASPTTLESAVPEEVLDRPVSRRNLTGPIEATLPPPPMPSLAAIDVDRPSFVGGERLTLPTPPAQGTSVWLVPSAIVFGVLVGLAIFLLTHR
jgi:serine/threonine-protein kinase